MDLKYYRQLFADLNNLSNQLSYANNLVSFDEYVDFYIYLDIEQEETLYNDNRYYYLDNLKENLKEIAENYIRHCRYGTLSMQKDIPYIPEPITEMLLDLHNATHTETITDIEPSNLTAATIAAAVEKGVNNALKPTQPPIKFTKKQQWDLDVERKTQERYLRNLQKHSNQ